MLEFSYAFVLIIAVVLLKLIELVDIQVIVILFAFLTGLFLSAMDSRSLNYIYYHPKKSKEKLIVISNFILKLVGLVLLFLYFFYQDGWLFVGIFIIAAMEIGIYFMVRKWLYSDVTFRDPPLNDEEKNLRRDIALSYCSYLITVCLIFFPNYKNVIYWYFMIPTTIAIIAWMKFTKKILTNNESNKYLTYTILFFLSLISFVVTKYVLGVESPISIPVLISLLIMLPYFSQLAKFMRKKKDK